MRRSISRGPGTRVLLTVIVCALVAAGCSDDDPMSASSVRMLREQWEQRKPPSYVFEIVRSCFCPPEVTSGVVVEVVDRIVTRRLYRGSGEEVSAQHAHLFPDIDGLFDELEATASRGPERLEVEFHAHYRFPERVIVDHRREWADDERSLRVTFLGLTPSG